ncbi:MAG: HD domain-containing protein [Clostridia bacterium]|nr:HD domain-containing protein [Clostridia bacterium]
MITYEQIKNSPEIRTYVERADACLEALGYTEHSFAHVTRVAVTAGHILKTLGYPERVIELAKIAGFMHDIGNLVNRVDHSQSGAILAFQILNEMGMEPREISDVISAIGNHDEGTGVPVSAIAAALILADKSDVRRSRVRDIKHVDGSDIHDNVNYSVTHSELVVSEEKKYITLRLELDTEVSAVMDYFEIFLGRMKMCRGAAQKLGLVFRLNVNGQILL